MPTVSKEKVLSKITVAGKSATAIAKDCGLSKAAQIKDQLAELLSQGSIVSDTSGRYEIFKKSQSVGKAVSKETVVAGETVKDKLPEANESDLRGFKIDNIKYKGSPMKKVTTPDGKKIRMKPNQKLLVINNEPKYLVENPEDVVTCFRKYALDNNLTVFTIDDLKQNRKISNDKDVQITDDHILFMSIKKHNKAA